jgi:hypothetical protein
LDFPACVIGDQPELTSDSLEIGDSQQFCWRNMFSCINLLRILNKLTKWKHSRIMVNNSFVPITCYVRDRSKYKERKKKKSAAGL